MHTRILLCLLSLLAGCNKNSPPSPSSSPPPKESSAAVPLTLTSPSIKEGQRVDARFTCDGEDRSPALSWSDLPKGTQSLTLIMDDPDAPSGTFTHWVLYGVAASRSSLPEGMDKLAEIKDLARQGKNDFGKLGYGGPCPPAGKPHHYRFKIFALAAGLSLPPGSDRSALERAMEGKILAQGLLTGTYQRAQ
jgi:Raf kinase inhibitor-like YbhB/YbcL family protein